MTECVACRVLGIVGTDTAYYIHNLMNPASTERRIHERFNLLDETLNESCRLLFVAGQHIGKLTQEHEGCNVVLKRVDDERRDIRRAAAKVLTAWRDARSGDMNVALEELAVLMGWKP